jgi:hypothetical protein
LRVYTVHESADPPADRTDRAEELRFIKDGFSWSAAIFAPLWMLLRGLWLALLIYIAAMAALRFGLRAVGIGDQISSLVFFAVHILIGFEADTIERWTLARRGWRMIGSVTGRDAIECERRFFDSWLSDQPLLRPDTLTASTIVGNGDVGATLGRVSRRAGGWRSTFVTNR